MNTILSCTDGSCYSNSVYAHTAWAAARLGAEVHVLHMLEHKEVPAPADASGTLGIDTQNELLAELVELSETQGRLAQAKAKALLAHAKLNLEQSGVSKVILEQQHGELVDSIERFEASADLVVLGKRGEHADFAKLHLGSNLERVIRSCHHPVLVAARAYKPIERFLLAYDGGPSAKKALAYALEQPLLKGLNCHLVCAGKPTQDTLQDLNTAKQQLEQAGYAVRLTQAPGHPETLIDQEVKEHDIQLLVMGAYGHSRIRQFIVGSTTTTMVRTVQIPVLLFR